MTLPGLPPPKLVAGLRPKVLLAVGCLVVLGAGWAVAPPQSRKDPPVEKVAPILEQRAEVREPARVFRGLKDVGRRALRHAVTFFEEERPAHLRATLDFALPEADRAPRGFGLVVSPGGEVLTHLAALGGSPRAVLSDGNAVGARLVAFEAGSGLGLVQVDAGRPLDPAPFAPGPATPGDVAVASAGSGSAARIAPVFVASQESWGYTLGAGGALAPGTPLYTPAGEALAVAAADATALAAGPGLERLRARLAAGRGLPASLGLVLQPPAPEMTRRWGDGVPVADVRPGSAGERAGIRPGDLLLRIGDRPVTSVEEAIEVIAGLVPGETATAVVRRARRERALEVVPEPARGSAPPATGGGAVALSTVFDESALAAAGLPPGARLRSVEGTPVSRAEQARQAMRRRPPPWIVWVESGGRRFFAVVGRSE